MLKRFLAVAGFVFAIALAVSQIAHAATPFGGDDTGFIPSGGVKSGAGKCELGVSKALSKYIACVVKCHESRASGKLATPADEETCEDLGTSGKNGCLAKYNNTVSKLKDCPSCSNPAGNASLAESLLDANNGTVWCASPSGAFIDGALKY
jgi:hypothetical protein